MKGIIHNLLEEVVIRNYGPDQWDSLLEAAGQEGAYTSLGTYPDEQIHTLLAAAATALHMSANDALRWFGRQAMPLLAERYPDFFRPHRSTRTFVLSTNDIIHPQVRMLYAGASCPNFEFADDSDGGLLMDYRSARHMCALAQGFVEGAAPLFHESVQFEHRRCMLRGDAHCLCWMRFTPFGAAA